MPGHVDYSAIHPPAGTSTSRVGRVPYLPTASAQVRNPLGTWVVPCKGGNRFLSTLSTQSKYLENPGTDRNRFQRDVNIHSIRFQQDLNIYSIRFHHIQNIYSPDSSIYKLFTQPGSSRCPALGLLTP